MTNQIYQIISLSARFWFIFLLFIIVWRCFVWLRRDTKSWKKFLKALPSAGIVGEAVVILGNSHLQIGTKIEVVREGIMGSKRNADFFLPDKSIKKHALYFRLDENKGLFVSLLSNNKVSLNNIEVNKKSNQAYIINGSILRIEDILLKFYFYQGFGVPSLSSEEIQTIEKTALEPFDLMSSYANLEAQFALAQNPNQLPYNTQGEQHGHWL